MLALARIVSGGQTGVDRGALDAALDCGFPCGGWCPEGRLAEDGRIADRYPLQVLSNAGYAERTGQNVLDSDATLVLFHGRLEGGTEYTVRQCVEHARPYELIDAGAIGAEQAATIALEFVAACGARILNVAGPRQSKWPGAHAYARRTIGLLLNRVARDPVTRTSPTAPRIAH